MFGFIDIIWWRRLFWIVLAAVLVLAWTPNQMGVGVENSDKINHIAAFVVLSLLGYCAYGFRGWVLLGTMAALVC